MPASLPSRILLARARPIPARVRPTMERAFEDVTLELTVDRPRPTPDPQAVGDVVIDLTGPLPVAITKSPPAPAPGPTRPRSRRVGVLVALIGVAVLAVSVVAALNYRAAWQWRERSRAAELRASRALADAAASRDEATRARHEQRRAQRRRRALAQQLAVSEADAAALEARVIALAGDRAHSEDVGGAVTDPAVADLVRSLQAQADSCVAQVEAARAALVDQTAVAGWEEALTAARATCEQVAADADVLAAPAR